MAYVAYCDRTGTIEVGKTCPDGMLPFYRCPTKKECLEKASATARHAYDGKTLLVPGIPEAIDDEHALEALLLHRAWLAGDNSDEIVCRRKDWQDRLFNDYR